MIDERTLLSGLMARLPARRARPGRPRFWLTDPAPCPYLPGQFERKLFTELRGQRAAETAEQLGRMGFRRSQNVAYRPACDSCRACVSVRIPVAEFTPSASQRRLARANADLISREHAPWSTPEQYALLREYLGQRHPDGGMTDMDALDYADMVEQTPVETRLVEYRGPDGVLVAAAIVDAQEDGLSMIYSFYRAGDRTRPGLGTFAILDQIERARAAGAAYVYLGYWVPGGRRMDYKARFRPLEYLTRDGWSRDPGLPAR